MNTNALAILEKRYLKRDSEGKLETPEDMFRRVAKNIASADGLCGVTEEEITDTEETFYQMMVNLEFLPNSPTLRGAGRELQQLAGCFVVPIEDDLESIFDSLKAVAMIHKTGGGVGYSFSNLRPRGDVVSSTGNVAGGPISFMKVFNAATQEITQGGVRMGANMGILRVDHPDILEFITCKDDGKTLKNFNISVAVTDDFMKAVQDNTGYELVNPRTGEVTDKLAAWAVFDSIVESAWRTGDPGVLFIDEVNRHNPTPLLGEIEATNPCGEQPLLSWESCVLGSINLAKMVKNGAIQWAKLERTTKTAVHFLDNVIDVNKYPLPEIESRTRDNRKIGLGVMGFADMLVQLDIAYDSKEALQVAEQVMEFISKHAVKMSRQLSTQLGVFPNFIGSITQGGVAQRNASITTIAPNGTIGVIAGCNGGIEPFFALAYRRHTLFDKDGATEALSVVNEWFEKVAKDRGFYSPELMKQVAETGSIQHVDSIPSDVKRVFVTAHDISPEWHVEMLAAFQKHVDNAISKTINFRNDATVKDVKDVFLLAHQLGCKGITIYRDGCRDVQVLDVGTKTQEPSVEPRERVLKGETYRSRTPLGTAYVTVNENEGQPFEVFVNVGNAGSDIAAMAEAIGRLISLVLRLPSSLSSTKRVVEAAEQLAGIRGRRSLGFGPNRILSLPDAIAHVLNEYIGVEETTTVVAVLSDICPECGQANLVSEEGCKKCLSCGYSEC